MENFKVAYRFQFPDSKVINYSIELGENTLKIEPLKKENLPDWTKLDYQKCSHCPLNSDESPFCPVAATLTQVVDTFDSRASFEEAIVQVTTPERTYQKAVLLQEGIFSLYGLIIPFTGCPHMKGLRPMARYHLPFASTKETIIRTVSFYLLKQYFVAKKGQQPDLSLVNLEQTYRKIKKVNEGMLKRIRSVVKKDPELNAMVILGSLSDLLAMAISNELATIESLFS